MGLIAWRGFSSIPNFRAKRFLEQSQQDSKDTGRELRDTERIRDKIDYILSRGVFRSGSNFVTNNVTTIYTVPAGTIFYLISGVLQVSVDAANVDSNAFLLVKGLSVLRARSEGIPNFVANMPLSFSIPIRMTVGEKVEISSGNANLVVTGSFTGYELTVEQDRDVEPEEL